MAGNIRRKKHAGVGVTEHGNSAELVTVSKDHSLLDRRRIDLTGGGLPTHPYHHEGSWAVGRYKNSPWAKDISLDEAVALVHRVERAAGEGAKRHLAELAATIPVPISVIAIRECPELPPGVEERIRDNRAQAMADTVMYRLALAEAAKPRGWKIVWYDRDHVFDQAKAASGCEDINAFLRALGREVGPPWQARHKLAAAAAVAALSV